METITYFMVGGSGNDALNGGADNDTPIVAVQVMTLSMEAPATIFWSAVPVMIRLNGGSSGE